MLTGWKEKEKGNKAEEPWHLVENKRKQGKKAPSEPKEKKLEPVKPEKQAAAKRKTGYSHISLCSNSSSSSSAPMQSSPSPASETEASLYKEAASAKEAGHHRKTPICIDWHGVFQVTEWGEDKAPSSHINALWDLQAAGYENCLVSFSGWKREQEGVAEKAASAV